MRFLSGIFFSLTMGTFATSQELDTPPIPDKSQFHLILLAGQSNMAGRGELKAPAETTNPQILALNASGEWVVAKDPVHFDKPIAGVGLAISFAKEYLKDHPGVTVGLIPSACGGSPISAWKPGTFFEATKSHPWDDALDRANIALKKGTLKAILWHQGESDSHEGLSNIYQGALVDLIHRFREAFAAADLPFVMGQLGQFGVPWNEQVKAVDLATRNVAEDDERASFVSSEGLEDKGDDLHFSAKALSEFGRRYYAAYRTIVNE